MADKVRPPARNSSGDLHADYHEITSEGWQRVNRDKRKRYDANCGRSNNTNGFASRLGASRLNEVNQIVTSVYFTNFPIDVTDTDLWKRFKTWGNIVDVFVSKRLSKLGKRFGFARFIKVNDIESLIHNLRSIWFEKHKLFADEVRFKQHLKPVQAKSFSFKSVVNGNGTNPNNAKPSFADIVKGKQELCYKKVISIAPKEIPLSTTSCSLFGKLKEPSSIPTIRNVSAAEGFLGVDFSYIGGRWINLVFLDVTTKERYMECKSLATLFDTFESPSGVFVPDERMVWLEMSGLPMGAWHREALFQVAGIWGKGMFTAIDDEEPCAIGKVCTLVPNHKYICESVVVKCHGLLFDVHVREYTTWAPSIANPTNCSESDKEQVPTVDSNVLDKDCDIGSKDDTHSISSKVEETSGSDELKPTKSHLNNGLDEYDIFLLNKLLHQEEIEHRAKAVKAAAHMKKKVSSDSSPKTTSPESAPKTQENKTLDSEKELDNDVRAHQDNPVNEVIADLGIQNDGKQQYPSVVFPSTPPATENLSNLNHATQCFSWLDYVSPTTNSESDCENILKYRDPQGKTQGPFSITQLNKWIEHFPMDFKIWSTASTEKESILLHNALKRHAIDKRVTSGSNFHTSCGSLNNSDVG